MTHPLVDQLRFTRSEWLRALDGVSDAEARRRFEPMNCISWMIGHLATQENAYWVLWGQGKELWPDLNKLVGFGSPPSTPPLEEMWAAWQDITHAADTFLESLTPEGLLTHLERNGQSRPESIGTMLYRNIYHYWYHLGEARAVRQLLGHTNLPEFVGDLGIKAPYRPGHQR